MEVIHFKSKSFRKKSLLVYNAALDEDSMLHEIP